MLTKIKKKEKKLLLLKIYILVWHLLEETDSRGARVESERLTSLEAVAIVQKRENGGMNKVGSSRDYEKHVPFGHAVKVEPTYWWNR